MDNKNEIKCKFEYKCGICGQTYSDVVMRAQCELACAAKQEEETRRAAELKKKEEQAAAHKELTQAIDAAYDLLNKYTEKYGTYTYDGKITNLTNVMGRVNIDDFIPGRLLKYFL